MEHMKTKIYITVIFILIGLPVITSASSLAVSLVQGKTPTEAISILAGQIDSLLGRVELLESAQVETTQTIDILKSDQEVSEQKIQQTNLEIEKLKLENENLRLKNQSLDIEATRISKQVIDSEKAIGAVGRCQELETRRICALNTIKIGNKEINTPDLLPSASLSEVISAMGGEPWYAKPQTDEICWKFSGWQADLSKGEKCRSRASYIQNFNDDNKEHKRQGVDTVNQGNNTLQSTQKEFEDLQCEIQLNKYAPNRKIQDGGMCA